MALPQLGYQMVLRGSGKFFSDMQRVNREVEGTNKTLSKTQKASQAFETGLGRASTVGIAAIAGMGAAALKMGQNFETAFAKVQTLFPGAEGSVESLRSDILDLSQTMGVDAVGATDALYQALSAGVPKNNAISFMETASKAAVGGSIELTQAVDVLTSTMNAFQLESSDAERVSDLLFTTVARGKTDMDQLSRSMFQVAPAASAAGIELEEVTAALASITKQGVPTSVATTQLRQAIVELQKPGAELQKTLEAIGHESGSAALEALGLQGTLAALEQAAAENGLTLTQVFSSVEAGSAALALTGDNAKTAADDLDAMTEAAGATNAAFRTMDQTGARSAEKAFQRFRTELISTGQTLVPIVADITNAASDLLSAFSSLEPSTQKLVLAVGALVTVAPKAASAINAIAGSAKVSRLALTGWTAALGGAVIALDQVLQRTTGAGVFDHIFGDPKRIRAAEDALRDFNDQFIGMRFEDAGERMGRSIEILRETAEETAKLFDEMSQHEDLQLMGPERREDLIKGTEEFKRLEETVKLAADELANHGATAQELLDVYNDLHPALQDAYLDQLNISESGLEAAAAENELKAASEKSLSIREELNAAQIAGLEAYGQQYAAQRDLTAQTPEFTGVLADARRAFDELALSLGDAEEGTRDYGAAWNEVLAPIGEMNPAVLTLNSEIALLDDKIADLKGSTGELTEAQEKQIEAWRNERDELAEQRDAITSHEETVRTLVDTMTGLTDLELADFGALTQELRDQGVEGGELVTVYGDLQAALDEVDPSVAVTKLGELKSYVVENFGAGTWESIISTIGPELASGMATAEPDVRAAARDLGIPVPVGFARGVEEGAGSIGPDMDLIIGGEFSSLDFEEEGKALGRPVPGYVASGVSENSGQAAAAGFAISSGIAAGMQSYPWWSTVMQLKNGILGLFGVGLGISSPSRVMRDEVGIPIAQGVAQGIEEGSDEALEAISSMIQQLRRQAEQDLPGVLEQFNNAVADWEFRETLETELGDLGADIAEILTEAVADPEGRYGDQLVRTIKDMIAEAREVGVPNAEEIGAEIMEGIRAALESGSPEAIDEVLGMIADLNTAIQEKAGEPGRTMIDAFMDGYQGAKQDRRMEEQIGSDGARFVQTLRDAIESESPSAIERVGEMADALLATWSETLSPDKANELSSAFMTALRNVIESEGEVTLNALIGILRDIHAAREEAQPGAGAGDGGAGAGGGGSDGRGGRGSSVPRVDIRPDSDWYNPRTGTEYRIKPGSNGKVLEYRRPGSNTWYTQPLVGITPDEYVEDRGLRVTPRGGTTTGTGRGGATTRNPGADDKDPDATSVGGRGRNVRGFQEGLSYVPYDDFMARLHAGEAVLTREQAEMWRSAMAPWAAVAAPGGAAVAGGAGDTNVVVDLRGSSFNGTPEENGAVIRRAVNQALADNMGQQALIQGIRRSSV